METSTKILIVEHDSNDLELIQHELKMGGIKYVSEVVQNEQAYIYSLENFIPDIILSDYTFPSFKGPTAFKIREKMAPHTPFIFVSGTIGEEKSIELIKNGVTDYALKEKLFTLHFKVVRALKEAKERQQKKKAEEELIISERKLARAQQLAHMGDWELDFSGDIIRLSDEACRIYGLMPGQNLQSFETWLSFIHPEDIEFVSKKVKEFHDSSLDFSISYRILPRNASIRHIYSEGKPEFDSDGKISGLYGIICDETEKVCLENKLAMERHMKQSEITAAVLIAQENERSAIGRELNDNLSQILAAAKLHIELAKTNEKNRMVFLDKSSVYIINSIGKIMKISRTLTGPGIQAGLFNCIKNLIADLTETHPIEIQFYQDGINENYMNEDLQLSIFRIVQEQLSNILKHAKATRAVITLSRKNNEVILLITDNGKGSDVLEEVNGVGIRNIKSRAELHNGMVTIISDGGKGFELKVALSLNGGYLNKPANHRC